MSKVEHGANLFELALKYKFNIEDIMDFSSNINPFGASPKALEILQSNPNIVSIYPDPSYTELKNSISQYTQTNSENILLGSGATGLISGFIKYIHPKNSIVISPAYSEYKKELQNVSSNVTEYLLHEKNNFMPDLNEIIQYSNQSKCEMIVICNPNNPTGSIFSNKQIEKLLLLTNAHILVDETYIEFTDLNKYSSSKLINKYPKLFVIRGTSKFFSTPGIRLGYALSSNKELKEHLSTLVGLWGINIFADKMGQIMFIDKEYQNKIHNLILCERNFILNELKKIKNINVYPSFGNFILSKITNPAINAKQLYDLLIPDKIVIRDCSSFPGLGKDYFRVCTLKPTQNKLLIEKLNNILT